MTDTLVTPERTIDLDRAPLSTGGEPMTEATIHRKSTPIPCDAYNYGLLTFFGETEFRVPFTQLLSEPHRIQSTRRVTENNHEYISVDLEHRRARIVIWFDPRANYLARRVQLWPAEPKGDYGDHRVVEFLEPAPSIFFPARVESMVRDGNGRTRWKFTTVITDVRVNRPIAPDVFEMRLPPGILVSDLMRKKMLRTDVTGAPTLPALTPRGTPMVLDDSPWNSTETPQYATKDEPRPWISGPRLLALGLGCLLVAGAIWAIRRFRVPVH